jgi:hypothetical protein
MKFLLTVLLIASFSGIAVFGLFMMHGANHEICPFSSVQGTDCMQVDGPLQSALLHLKAFLAFSSVTLLSLVLAVFFLASEIFIRSRAPSHIFQYVKDHASFISRFQILENYWFSLTEHSPTT